MHTAHCENSMGHSCRCPCGGARHGGLLIKKITAPARVAESAPRAEPRQWTRLPKAVRASTVEDRVVDRQPAIDAIVSDLILAVLERPRTADEIDVIRTLADEISNEIGDEFERHLGSGRPRDRGTDHIWCVVLASVCRLYDHGVELLAETADDLVDQIIAGLSEAVPPARTDETKMCEVYQFKHRAVAAFELSQFPFLEALMKRAARALVAAAAEIGEDAVIRHLRLIAAIICPNPDRHPDVVKYCVWPLVSGPFTEALGDSIATEMQTWLRNAYRSVSAA